MEMYLNKVESYQVVVGVFHEKPIENTLIYRNSKKKTTKAHTNYFIGLQFSVAVSKSRSRSPRRTFFPTLWHHLVVV